MKTILFQGDSITDCGRDRRVAEGKFSFKKLIGKSEALGNGYPLLVTRELEKAEPGKYSFINRGVSGDRILDVYARIVKDIIKIKPDYMSLLIGVNDVWHELLCDNGTTAKRFEKVYDIVIGELKEELPELKIMILEPFVLEGSATKSVPEDPDRYNKFRKGVEEMASIAKAIAEKHNLKFVPLQAKFDEEAKKYTAAEMASDGVHPTPRGHGLIRNEWLKAFNEIA